MKRYDSPEQAERDVTSLAHRLAEARAGMTEVIERTSAAHMDRNRAQNGDASVTPRFLLHLHGLHKWSIRVAHDGYWKTVHSIELTNVNHDSVYTMVIFVQNAEGYRDFDTVRFRSCDSVKVQVDLDG